MSIFSIEPYESILEKGRRKETFSIELELSNDKTNSYEGYFESLLNACKNDFQEITKEWGNVVQTNFYIEPFDGESYILLYITVLRDEIKQEYYNRRQREINKLKSQMDKEEVRKIEEADRLKKEYSQYLALQEKFKDFDPSTLI